MKNMLFKNDLPRAGMRAVALLVITSLIAGCATPQGDAEKLAQGGQYEAALDVLKQAGGETAADAKVRAAYLKQRDAQINRLLLIAEDARLSGRMEVVWDAIARIEALSPGHPRAAWLREALARDERFRKLLAEGNAAFDQGRIDAAEKLARAMLEEDPGNVAARSLLARIAERQAEAARDEPLLAASAKPVTLEFREAPLKSVFEALARAAGVNFVFDKDVRGDTKVTLFLRNTTVDEAMRVVLATQQLDRKLLNDNSVLIYPNNQQKQREHQELVTRSFYLVNADVKQAQTLIRTMAKSRDIFVDERLNLIVVRDTPDVMRLVDRLIESIDLAEPEVMLDVQVMEVSSSRVLELGLDWPNVVNYGVPGLNGAISSLNKSDVRAYVANPAVVARLNGTTGVNNLLAHPKIRARNREKAHVQIGEKLPVFTSTATANVGVSSSVSYLDVGLKLDVEPQVQLDSDIVIKVALEVSSVNSTVTGPDGSIAYRVGTRQTTTSLRLKDGETQILAGLINDNDRRSIAGVPGLIETPVLGALFGVRNDTHDKQEIVLLITPRIIRNVNLPVLAATPLAAGTESQPGAASLRMRGGRVQVGQAIGAGTRTASARSRPGASVGAQADESATSAQAAQAAPSGEPTLGGPEEVIAGGGFQVTVVNPGDQPLSTDVIFDAALFDTRAPGASPGRVPLQVPAGGRKSVAFNAKAQAGEGASTFQLASGSASLAVRVRAQAAAADEAAAAPRTDD